MTRPTAAPIRIVLLDDHALIREALKTRLSLEPDVAMLCAYSTSGQLLEGLREQQVDLLILDYQLSNGEIDGLRLIQLVRSQHPDVKIIIFSAMEGPATINMSNRAGVCGFVGKSQVTDDLIFAIRKVAQGEIYLSPKIMYELEKSPKAHTLDLTPAQRNLTLTNDEQLSPKEREVLRCCLEGLSVTQIALKFSRSRKTISTQKRTAFRKLGIQTDTELFKLHAQF